jgi:hypothetical protein
MKDKTKTKKEKSKEFNLAQDLKDLLGLKRKPRSNLGGCPLGRKASQWKKLREEDGLK